MTGICFADHHLFLRRPHVKNFADHHQNKIPVNCPVNLYSISGSGCTDESGISGFAIPHPKHNAVSVSTSTTIRPPRFAKDNTNKEPPSCVKAVPTLPLDTRLLTVVMTAPMITFLTRMTGHKTAATVTWTIWRPPRPP